MGGLCVPLMYPTRDACPECGRPWFGNFFDSAPQAPTTDGGTLDKPPRKRADGQCGTCGRPL